MTILTPWIIAVALYVPFLPFAALAWIEPMPRPTTMRRSTERRREA